MKRRELIAATGAALAALGLKDLLGPAEALAQAKPKRGGKFVYTNLYPNNRMGDAKNGKHPYYLLDINTRSAFNGLAYVNDEDGGRARARHRLGARRGPQGVGDHAARGREVPQRPRHDRRRRRRLLRLPPEDDVVRAPDRQGREAGRPQGAHAPRQAQQRVPVHPRRVPADDHAGRADRDDRPVGHRHGSVQDRRARSQAPHRDGAPRATTGARAFRTWTASRSRARRAAWKAR